MLKSLGIFCGSNKGRALYVNAVQLFADVLSKENIKIVYGGAKVGLMGTLANRALENGSEVIGVIPRGLQLVEIVHDKLTELHIVETMHARKALMSELADGFVMLPGAAGTLDEFFEMVTWGQIHLHKKPYGILNINGFYNPLLNMLDQMVHEGFMTKVNRDAILVDESPQALLESLMQYTPTEQTKWIFEES